MLKPYNLKSLNYFTVVVRIGLMRVSWCPIKRQKGRLESG